MFQLDHDEYFHEGEVSTNIGGKWNKEKERKKAFLSDNRMTASPAYSSHMIGLSKLLTFIRAELKTTIIEYHIYSYIHLVFSGCVVIFKIFY